MKDRNENENRRNDERNEKLEFFAELMAQLLTNDTDFDIEVEEINKDFHEDKEFMDFAVNNDPFREDFGYSLGFNPFGDDEVELPSEAYIEGYTATTETIKEVIQELVSGICEEVADRNTQLLHELLHGKISKEQGLKISEFHEGTLDAVLDVLDFIEVSDEEE